jgi:DNA-directed RNA polymerase beta' subunit
VERLSDVTCGIDYSYTRGKTQIRYPHDRDVYFDQIVSIEHVSSTRELVYDLTVAGPRNFQLWNGVSVNDSFHHCGKSDKATTFAVPRSKELLDAAKKTKMKGATIFFHKQVSGELETLRENIGSTIVGLTLGAIAKSWEARTERVEEPWYDAHRALHGDTFADYTCSVSIKLDLDKMFPYKLRISDIARTLESDIPDIACVCSPASVGQLDIFVDTSEVVVKELEEGAERLGPVTQDLKDLIHLERCVIPRKLKGFVTCGIPGVTGIYYAQQDEEWIAETDGCDLRKIMAHDHVDEHRTRTNDLWEVLEVLGVEAARQYLIEEFRKVMGGINECHMSLVADRMTYDGTISSVTRYTMREDKSGPLGKASFEEAFPNFLWAGASGQTEPAEGVSAAIICGKQAAVGTGMVDILIDLARLEELEEEDEEDCDDIDEWSDED